jgi:pilus assembly protein Flp/PilA
MIGCAFATRAPVTIASPHGGSTSIVSETRMTFLRKIAGDRRGATAIEYGLIAALIAVAAIGAMSTLGTKLKNTFSNVSNNLNVQ